MEHFLNKKKIYKNFNDRDHFILSKGHAVDFSKYCPADIYIVDSNSVETLNKGIESCKDIFELNRSIKSYKFTSLILKDLSRFVLFILIISV